MLAAVGAIGLLVAASSLVEGRETGLAFAGELCRTVLVLGLIIFICFHVRGLHETREIEAILTRPISRHAFVIAYYAAFAVLAAALALLAAPILVMTLRAQGSGLLLWDASIVLEAWIVSALALFCAMALRSATAAVLVAIGFYALGRTAQYFLAIAQMHTGALDLEAANRVSQWILLTVGTLMPRLDLFGQSRWLVYGPGGGWGLGILALQAMIYVPLLLLATIRDLRVKTF